MKARRKVLIMAIAVASVGLAALWVSQLDAARPDVVPDPSTGPDRVVDRVRSAFPQTEGWFRIVATARYTTGASGRIVERRRAPP